MNEAETDARPRGFSCPGCPNRWTSLGAAHCAAEDCHRTFAAVGLFDRHRRGGTCLDPATLSGMEFREGLWRGPRMTDEQLAKRIGASA